MARSGSPSPPHELLASCYPAQPSQAFEAKEAPLLYFYLWFFSSTRLHLLYLALHPPMLELVSLFLINECTSTRPRARTKVDGACRIWGTMNQTSVKTAISRFCKMDGLSIKRKTKTGSSKSSWWFVVHANKKVLCDLESKWDEVHLHTSWMLQACSKPDNNPTNSPENVHVNDCSASAAIDQLESPPSSSPTTSITMSSDSRSIDDPFSDSEHPTTGSQFTDAILNEQNVSSQHADPFRRVHQVAVPPYTQ